MKKNTRSCFVCKKPLEANNFEINQKVFLPVCLNCNGTENEKKLVEEYLDSLADGLVCGRI